MCIYVYVNTYLFATVCIVFCFREGAVFHRRAFCKFVLVRQDFVKLMLPFVALFLVVVLFVLRLSEVIMVAFFTGYIGFHCVHVHCHLDIVVLITTIT